MHKNLLIILSLCFSSLKAQLVINETYTPQQLVQDYLVGGGVTVSNITFYGSLTSTGGQCNQIAYFSNGNSISLGMNAGIVLATGCVGNIVQSGSSFMSDNLNGSGVSELNSIAGNSTFDGTILEFDFVPWDNQISFTYIFGSEEYPEFVGSQYNDAFAFFISGGPEGYNNQNIALVPSTAIPVTINNVNSGSYSQYFIDNDNSSNQPVFDGYTTALNAIANVTPCQTYHLKICIADVGDHIYDSGVFLKRNSFSTDAINLVVTYSSGSAPAGEGCSTATVTAIMGNPPSSPVTVNYTISGTASNADFTQSIPTSITIPAGQTSTSFTLDPVIDGINEGTEYVVFSMTDPCGGVMTDTVYIVDNPVLSVDAGWDQTLCASAVPTTLTAIPTGGVPPYTYLWSNGSGNSQTVSVAPTTTTHYQVTVTDACGQTAIDDVDVIIAPIPVITITSNNNPICQGQTSTLSASGGINYVWDTGEADSTITVSPLVTTTYHVTGTDANGCSNLDSITVTVHPLPDVTVSASPSVICYGDTTTLTASGASSYSWDNGLGTGDTMIVSPTTTTTYSVTGTDANGCTATTQVTVNLFPQPNIFITGNNPICQGQTSTLSASGGINYVWDTGEVDSTITVSPLVTTTYHVTGTDANGCSDTASYQINVIEMPIANAGIDDSICGLTYVLNATPSVGNGTWSSPQNVSIDNVNSPTAQLTVNQTGEYMLIWTENNQGCVDADTVLIHLTRIPTSDFTADTIPCNGDASSITYNGYSEPNSVFTWSWDGGNALPGTGPGPHSVSWTTSGIHTITLTVSTNGCNSDPTSVIVFNPTPLNLTFSTTDILCYGDSTGAIDLTVSGGRQPYTYQWNNGQTVEDLTNIAAGIYTVTVTDASGCAAISGIEVTEPPQLVATVTPDQYSCIGATTYLTITATGGAGGYQYYWNGQLSNPTITVSPETTTTYYAYVIDANGCSTPILSMTVNVAPPLHVNLLANTDYVCPGDPVMLTPVIWGGVGPPYIIYNQDDDVVSPPIFIYPEQSGYYTIRVEDVCGSWDTAGVYIHVWPLPIPNIFADTLQGCVPLTVHFIETSPDSGQSYVWDFGDVTNLSLSQNPVHTYTTSGTFDVSITITSAHGCKNTVVYNDMISVWPKPNAAYTWEPEVVTEIKPVITFTNLSTGAEWYQWIFGDGDSSSVVNPEHRYPGKGEYETQLIAVSNKGCTDTAIAVIKILEQYTFYAPTAFSPDGDNNNDFFYIIAHGIKEEGFKLEIYDRWGEIIWSTNKFIEIEERSEKWDGRAKNNEIVPIGTYTWRCLFRDNLNNTHEEVGAISVIR